MKQLVIRLRQLEDLLLALLLTAMILLATGQILLRNLWDYGLSWGDPTLRLMVLWVTLLGAMAATRDNNHIRIDLLTRYLPDTAGRIARRLTDAFTALVCALLAWHAARFVGFEYQDGNRFLDLLPIWPFQLVMPIGFGIIALRLLLCSLAPQPPQEKQ
ncbi:C4-dicarboxylate ABC transporter permease [Sedimenticola thiotaurini]|uniref:TRAP transporter small permease protein n=1 Tax=Sedimenticola thiotaurini TaxID=1543721 RepID=A0A0F7K4Z6_9GAMM|nr:C4-dicarboxylate ABC transporter permease [Sedimenticola thiotaurini]